MRPKIEEGEGRKKGRWGGGGLSAYDELLLSFAYLSFLPFTLQNKNSPPVPCGQRFLPVTHHQPQPAPQLLRSLPLLPHEFHFSRDGFPEAPSSPPTRVLLSSLPPLLPFRSPSFLLHIVRPRRGLLSCWKNRRYHRHCRS